MSKKNILVDVSSQECFQYPYVPHDISPKYNDLYERPLAKLIASFASFGKRLVNNEVVDEELDTATIQSIVRMCEDQMLPSDYDVMIRKAPNLKTSKIIGCNADLNETLEASISCEQVIIACMLEPKKWAIFLVSLVKGDTDVYLIGAIKPSEIQPFVLKLHAALEKAFPEFQFPPFKLRLKFPRQFKIEPVLAAVVLAYHLHLHGKYLDLSEKTCLLHKYVFMQEYTKNHDKSLGLFSLENVTLATHPFVIKEFNPEDQHQEILDSGWKVIDVTGDGNCGYYGLLVGLENNGNLSWRPITTMKGNPTGIHDHIPWQKKNIAFRKRLYDHCQKLRKEKIKIGGENQPDLWLLRYRQEDLVELPKSIYNSVMARWKFNRSVPNDSHMEFDWTSLVFASLFKMRVVVIARFEGWNNETKEIYVTWTTHIFNHVTPFESELSEEESPHVSHEQRDGVHRLPDEDLRQTPTIELLFYCGQDVDIKNDKGKTTKKIRPVKHFLFLRRVLCDNTPIPKKLSSVKLRKALERNFEDIENASTSSSTRLKSITGRIFDLADDQQNARKRKQSSQTENMVSTSRKRTKPSSKEDQLATRSGLDQDPTRKLDSKVVEQEPTRDLAKITEQEQTSEVANKVTEQEQTRELANKVTELEQTRVAVMEQEQPRELANNATSEQGRVAVQGVEPQQISVTEQEQPRELATNATSEKGRVAAQGVEPQQITESEQTSRNNQVAKQVMRGKVISAKRMKKSEAEKLAEEGKFDELGDYFDGRYRIGNFEHAARLYYDSSGDFFMVKVYDFDHQRYSQPKRVATVTVEKEHDKEMIALAKKNDKVWVGCGPGDPCDGFPPPMNLATRIPTIYQQHNQRFCLTYSLASALFYCGFKDEASILASTARFFSTFHFDEAISKLIALMENLVPEIGRATVFERRTKNHNRRLRHLTWQTIFTDIQPYPTLIIPVLPDGSTSHAFCVVDDLIFDSITQYALKLEKESLNWMFNDSDMNVFLALRFETKISPASGKLDQKYQRKVAYHWDHPQSVPDPPPEPLITQVPTLYERHSKEQNPRFCLIFSFASALFYCGFNDVALELASNALLFSDMHLIDILSEVREFMRTRVPEIGAATVYPFKGKKKNRRRGCLTWDTILKEFVPHPTIIIPLLPNGKVSDACCIVDDLIFHPISPRALKLQQETLNWIYNYSEVRIHKAIRFATKISQPHQKVEREYNRTVAINWDRS